MTDLPYPVVLDNLNTMRKTKVFEKELNVQAVVSVLKDLKRIKDAKINPIEVSDVFIISVLSFGTS